MINTYCDSKRRLFKMGQEFLSLEVGDDILIRATVIAVDIREPRQNKEWPHVRVRTDLDGGTFMDDDSALSLGLGAIDTICPKPWKIGDKVRVDTPSESVRGVLLGIHRACGWVEVEGREAPMNYRWAFITRA